MLQAGGQWRTVARRAAYVLLQQGAPCKAKAHQVRHASTTAGRVPTVHSEVGSLQRFLQHHSAREENSLYLLEQAFSAPQLPPGHRFPMGVFQRIFATLIQDGTLLESQVRQPDSSKLAGALELVHDVQYLQRFLGGALTPSEERRIGFGDTVRTPALIERTLSEVAGTLLTAELALQHGLACSTAGGTHHAHSGFGSGFCIINDIAVTAASLLKAGHVKRVLVLDLDVHQGDGTASIFQREPNVFTVSVHAAANFPARKADSDCDVPLPDGTGDADYLRPCTTTAKAATTNQSDPVTRRRVLGGLLPEVLAAARPELVIYDAGVDVHADDALGRLALSDDGIRRRELMVLDTCLAAGVPVAGLVGGGYAADVGVLARRHCLLHEAAARLWIEHGL